MPHDERMLKSAYKQQSRGIAHGGLMYSQGGQARRNGYTANKSYDTRQDHNMSPEIERHHNDVEQRYERSKRRWDLVLDKKL